MVCGRDLFKVAEGEDYKDRRSNSTKISEKARKIGKNGTCHEVLTCG